ncbi:hypothetical protein [Leisingera methylohalidivorans]|uniref:Uncharacterized protein n=1 Tax=Leisingera methylohalidivorans DSM 14336 TaxID=999552 RepID=V9W092_9RHOB|nr:hypothetical protein [Leisingera methylohalidivorans]AHD03065.1 hypothetical protein METH_10415 [Leisingera methylohalidivorans DSM 14336]
MNAGMGLELTGRPGPMAGAMRNVDPRRGMDMPMAAFGPVLAGCAITMAR